jgi:DNA-binding transcriptional ArsR family regulator
MLQQPLKCELSRFRERETIDRSENPRVALLRELADPIRLRVVDRLALAGPATVSELAAGLDSSLPRLSNHLRRLREAGLVATEQRGRSTLYRLADPGLSQLLTTLDHVTGAVAPEPAPGPRRSRTCYDHLAGPLGVGLYRALRERDALRVEPDGVVVPGPAAAETLAPLGVDVDGVAARGKRLAFECFDATEHRPHLAGALGDGLAAALLDRGWVRHGTGREVEATPAGKRGLRRTLGLAIAA